MSETKKRKRFPVIPQNNWRSDWPYIVTLSDGARLPAYPVIGRVDADNNFCFGEHCTDTMWYVSDRLVEHSLITELVNARIIRVECVVEYQDLQPF